METVHCINLPTREDRRSSALKQSIEQGFLIQFWEGITTSRSQPFKNIAQAHKQIVSFAKQSGQKHITIMEDDCIFTDPNSFKYFLSEEPEEYDLYMGLIYAGYIENNRVMGKFSGGMTLYRIRSQFYDTFIGADPEDHIDRWCGSVAKEHAMYVVDPMVVTQSGGYSDNLRRFMTYENYLIGKKLFRSPERKEDK